jgi:CRISPR-associated protein Csd2
MSNLIDFDKALDMETKRTPFEKKVDFVALVSVANANPNGDPLDGNRPRTDSDGYGEISDVCIKRKIRNRLQDFGKAVFVQSDDRVDDEKPTLKARIEEYSKIKSESELLDAVCKRWIDIRSFGATLTLGKGFGVDGLGVRGPVSIHMARSVDPVEIYSMQITKSVSWDKKEGATKGSDTMGEKHFVRYGLYVVKGSINVQLAKKTGFSEEDADILKKALLSLFVNDTSSARPDGSMEVAKLYWWKHNCDNGQVSTAKVHRSVHVYLKDTVREPHSFDDYVVEVDRIPGLEPEVLEGF